MKIFILIIFIKLSLNNFVYAATSLSCEQELRANKLFSSVKCVVCQGQAIKDSNAEIAMILKRSIRQQIAEGKSDKQIMQFLELRYGEQINMNPKFNIKNSLLWLLPLVFIISIFKLAWKNMRLNA